MKVNTFVEKALSIANNYKTLYVMGCFGSPLYPANKKRFTTNHSYNRQSSRTKMINNASSDTFGFDCVCLIKGILWGWNGDKNKTHGGAVYCSNGVPDVNADTIIKHCTNVRSDMNNISIGEVLWMSGHVGIFIGNYNGVPSVVECTPNWKNGVQITKLSQRKWLKHGYLKYIDYSSEKPSKSIEEIAREVINGKWGNGNDRKVRLTNAGYDYKEVQNKVNSLLKANKKSNEEIAREVIQGKWGNGLTRKLKLTKAGYNYRTIQDLVNRMI